MKQTILNSLTSRNYRGRFWHRTDPDSQKSQLIVMAIMDQLFGEIYNVTSARQADRETHIKCSSLFWGSKKRGAGPTSITTHLGQCGPHTQEDQHTSLPQLGSRILSFKNILHLVSSESCKWNIFLKCNSETKIATCVFCRRKGDTHTHTYFNPCPNELNQFSSGFRVPLSSKNFYRLQK